MKINQILEEICNENGQYYSIILKFVQTKSKARELISELAISFIKNKDKVEEEWSKNSFRWWFVACVRNQVQSNTSPYYKNCIIPDKNQGDVFNFEWEYNEDREIKLSKIEDSMLVTNVDWFELHMFRAKFEEGLTYKVIKEKYGVNRGVASNAVKRVIEKIKKNI